MSKKNLEKTMGQAIVDTAIVSIGLDLSFPEWQNVVIDKELWVQCIRLITLSEKIQRRFLFGKVNNTAYIVGSANFVADVASAISFGLCAAEVLCEETDTNMLVVRRLPKNDMSNKITSSLGYVITYNYEELPQRDKNFLRMFQGLMDLVFTNGSITDSMKPTHPRLAGDICAYDRKFDDNESAPGPSEGKATDKEANNENCDESSSCEDDRTPQKLDDILFRSAKWRSDVISGKYTDTIANIIVSAAICDDSMCDAVPEVIDEIRRLVSVETEISVDDDTEETGYHCATDLASGVLDYILKHKYTKMRDLIDNIISLQDDVEKLCAGSFCEKFDAFCRNCAELLYKPSDDPTHEEDSNEAAPDTGADKTDDEDTIPVPTDSYM